MDHAYLLTLATTGFGVAFLHAALPTHWLPFVAIGRARGWTRRRTLAAVALAGGGHILTTTALGLGLAWFGFELEERFHEFFHGAVAVILIALGAWLAFRAPHGRDCNHCHGHPERFVPDVTDRAALWGLFLTLTLSPCELFLPVYLTAVPYGWAGLVGLSVVLGVATLGGMLVLTWLTLQGAQRLKSRWLDRVDRRVMGGLLCLLGLATVVFGH
jgi:nickel/cobalt transporter (NicO) family protein